MMAIIQRDDVENSMKEVCPASWSGIIMYSFCITKLVYLLKYNCIMQF